MITKAILGKRRTISISEETYAKLAKVGVWGESLDGIIKKCIAAYEEKKGHNNKK